MAARHKTGSVHCSPAHKEVAEILTQRGHTVTTTIAWDLERSALGKRTLDRFLCRLAEEKGPLANEESKD